MKVYHIPRTLVREWFAEVSGFIEGALALHPYLGIDDVLSLCETGPFVLTIVVNDRGGVAGCFVTEMLVFPKRRVVNIVFMGGDKGFLAHGLREGVQAIEDEAVRVGATGLCAAGRPGLLRVAKRCGLSTRVTTFAWKELTQHANEGRRQPEPTNVSVDGGAAVHH